MKKDIILLGLMLTIWLLALVSIIPNKEMYMSNNIYFDNGTIEGLTNVDSALLGLTGADPSMLGGYDVNKYTGTNIFNDYNSVKDWTGNQIARAFSDENDDYNWNFMSSLLGGAKGDDVNESAMVRALALDNPNTLLTEEDFNELKELGKYAGSLRKAGWKYRNNLTDTDVFKNLLRDIYLPENQKILAEKYGSPYFGKDGTIVKRFGVRELLKYMKDKGYGVGYFSPLNHENGDLSSLSRDLLYPVQNEVNKLNKSNLLKAEEDSRKKEEEARKNTWKYNTPEGAGWRLRDASEKIGETRSIQNVYRSRLKRGLNVDDDIELFGTTLLNAPINKKVNASESWSPRMMELSRNIDKLKNQEGEESKKELEKAKDELRELMKRKGGFIVNF